MYRIFGITISLVQLVERFPRYYYSTESD